MRTTDRVKWRLRTDIPCRCIGESGDGPVGLVDARELTGRIERGLWIFEDYRLPGLKHLETLLPVTFKVGAERAHDSLYRASGASRFRAFPKKCKSGLVFPLRSQRSAIQVIANFSAIAIDRSVIVSEKEIRMCGAGHQVGIQ